VNISCPNVQAEHGEMFAASPSAAAAATRAVKAATGIPCVVKLSPNVPSISAVARAVVDAGADALTAINTMPGMLIDAESGAPVLANVTGGISGPALKPIALRCVFEAAGAVDVPIIGTGGVISGTDAAEMIMAGAAAVGVGSAIVYRGEAAFSLILEELSKWMEAGNFGSLKEICGAARRPPPRKSSNPPPLPRWTAQ
jgi:dihydroorotate dehydrogenase (NAD+) catalytic subunit